MSPLAVGVGLTVVGANHAIHLKRHWNPAKEAQATDRIYRVGQTREVHVHYPIALHPDVESFDLNLDRLLRSKVALRDAVVVPREVTQEELERALGLSGAGSLTASPRLLTTLCEPLAADAVADERSSGLFRRQCSATTRWRRGLRVSRHGGWPQRFPAATTASAASPERETRLGRGGRMCAPASRTNSQETSMDEDSATNQTFSRAPM
ncbi:hypothetical protein J1G44_06135 [Cellulomonas sp. zg-ZUI199]|nr:MULTISPECIES: C-terminal helicase domain-containing protein [Cellulomonas]MBO0898938.1 hypothetical protein [Cellulomonas sp. zg-ZUI22]MBO0923775.1 hypothetical protein [Cellulomonas wangleii]MBO0924057.1 hypothetical protein [Cellulomonas wangleii]